MSFYALAFDPTTVDNAHFASWWDRESEWEGDHDYNEPDVAGPAVRDFFDELILTFPPMNGPLAYTVRSVEQLVQPDLESYLTDYSLAPDFVYAAFSWEKAQEATELVTALSAKHGLAVAWVSSDPLEITRPAEADSSGSEKRKPLWPWRRAK